MPNSLQTANNPSRRPRILIVDDDRVNRELLIAYLTGGEYELSEATSGIRALELAAELPPDLVLLDVMMPGMDGFEATRRLKSLSSEFLPVVLVTALDDTASRVRGFDAGADEFLTKPVSRPELLARLRNLLHLRFERQALARKHQKLQRLQEFREQATSLLVHDLKNPLGSVSLNIEYAASTLEAAGAFPDVLDALHDARSASRRLLRRIAEALDTARSEDGHLVARRAEVDISDLFGAAIREFIRAASERAISISMHVPEELRFPVDRDLIQRVLENLLENALRFTPDRERIELNARVNGDSLEILACNDGPAIEPLLRPQLFERFSQGVSSDHRITRGLGLYFCRLAAAAHGGSIDIVDSPSFATCFRILLPPADA
jgi:signal transduction histidine kinase